MLEDFKFAADLDYVMRLSLQEKKTKPISSAHFLHLVANLNSQYCASPVLSLDLYIFK